MSTWSHQETEQLIKFVQTQHCIRTKKTNDARIVITAWPIIAKTLNKTVKQCQDKWHRLKTKARTLSGLKCFCGYEPEVNWTFYKSLGFLEIYFEQQRANDEISKNIPPFQCAECQQMQSVPLPPVHTLLEIQRSHRLVQPMLSNRITASVG